MKGTSVSEIHRGLTNVKKLFGSQITICRYLTPKELEIEHNLNSTEFPEKIMIEILKLRRIMEMFNDSL
ncbi:unnamed protein product [marine sediment metagenome]|uniref:Uncharacterized protein n=1 Tax=marine sediment metagenome TaxID=412755 RepID=X1BQJ6_9ZZZZ